MKPRLGRIDSGGATIGQPLLVFRQSQNSGATGSALARPVQSHQMMFHVGPLPLDTWSVVPRPFLLQHWQSQWHTVHGTGQGGTAEPILCGTGSASAEPPDDVPCGPSPSRYLVGCSSSFPAAALAKPVAHSTRHRAGWHCGANLVWHWLRQCRIISPALTTIGLEANLVWHWLGQCRATR